MTLDRTWFNALVDDDGTNTVGTVWGKDDINAFILTIDLVQNGHCLCRTSAGTPIPNGLWTYIPAWDIRDADPTSMYAGGGIVLAHVAGVYGIVANIFMDVNGVGTRYAAIAINGTPWPGYPPGEIPRADSQHIFRLHDVFKLAAGSQISVVVYQNSGGVLNVTEMSRLEVWRIS